MLEDGEAEGQTEEGNEGATKLTEARAELRTLRAELKAAKERIGALEPLEAERGTWEQERATWGTEKGALAELLSLARVGVVDDEHAAAVRSAWAALPEDGRPASAADLWSGLAGKPVDEVPRTLRGFLPTQATSATQAAPTLPRGTATQPATADEEVSVRKAMVEARNRWMASRSGKGSPEHAEFKKLEERLVAISRRRP